MMKKGWIALLLAIPMMMTACLGGSGYEPSPVEPGIRIYSNATFCNHLSLLPTNVTIRLAMILGEAEKQKLDDDKMLDVENEDGTLLKNVLFSKTTTIEQNGTKFTITLPTDGSNYYHDGINSYAGTVSGQVEVETNGNYAFDSDGDEAWEITISDLKYNNYEGYTYSYDDGCKSTLEGSGGIYYISTEDFYCSYGNGYLLNNWHSTDVRLNTATMVSLAYSNVKDGEFVINGSGQDAVFRWSGSSVTFKASALNNGYLVGVLQSGTVNARFVTTDYDAEYFPSPSVEVVISNGVRVTYNGQTETF